MKLGGRQIGNTESLLLIAGPCVIESRSLVEQVAGRLQEIAARLGLNYVFKASFDKANRSSASSFRGPGLEQGLAVLEHVKKTFGLPVLTDVHEDTPLAEVAAVADVLQTPAFLCRQTNFIQNVARAGKPVNIKKGQFLSPWEMQNVVDKARATGNDALMVCERGASFGYNNLVADVLQTPAFLCRQTNFIQNVARAGRAVNIKKGQFLSPWEMQNVVDKARATGNDALMVCERGASFGYNNLVADMRSLAVMRGTGCPVIFDATHAVQLPGGQGASSGGQREFVPVLARAAVAAGVAGLFMETHPDPDKALSDGPNMWPLGRMESLLATLVELDRIVKSRPYEEAQ